MNTTETSWPFPTIMPNTNNSTQTTVPMFTSITEAHDRVNAALKQYREQLHDEAKAQNIGIVHIHEDGVKGGLTIAYRKCNEFKSGRMVEVAVGVCSIDDAFSKKVGVQNALQRFFDGETIQLPLLNNHDVRDLSYAVKSAFTVFYYSM